jgi:hypothetical protein
MLQPFRIPMIKYIYQKQPFVQLIGDIISGFNRKAFIDDTLFAE